MDKSGAAVWMLLATIGIPAAIGAVEAWRRQRGVLGWAVNIAVTVVAGVALTALLAGYSHDFGLRSELAGAATILGGLIGGALIALWVVNKVRS